MVPGFTVLVVDDEPLIGRLVRAMLERVGLRAVIVNSAAAAFEALKQDDFGLVITDIQMPACDGVELCAQLHQKYPSVPVIAMTGSGIEPHNEDLKRACAAGAKAALRKPFDLAEFYNAVNAAKWGGGSGRKISTV